MSTGTASFGSGQVGDVLSRSQAQGIGVKIERLPDT